jgi:UDP-N-acetylmuramate dehydrogenase
MSALKGTMESLIQENVSIAPLTTFGIGGEARYFAAPGDIEDIQKVLAFVEKHSLPLFVLGGGSNILVSDDGFPGLVLMPKLADIKIEPKETEVLVTSGAGVSWDGLVEQMVKDGYSGLEALSGIPGTVGGAVVANAGAYGAQCSDVFVSARAIDLQDASRGVQTFSADACLFSYHHSMFGEQPGRFLILDAVFRLARGNEPDFSYHDHRFNFTDILAAEQLPQTFAGLRSAVLSIREKKGVLQSSYKSAGSIFHMPKVSADKYAMIAARAKALDAVKEVRLRPWAWEQADGSYKIASAFLLEYTEFTKGYVRGAAGVSPKHQLCIINLGGACAREVASLAGDMQSAVEELFDLHLEREVQYVGSVE